MEKENYEELLRKAKKASRPDSDKYLKYFDIYLYLTRRYTRRFGSISYNDYQRIHRFKEVNYSIKEVEWKMLDFANPAWRPCSHRERGKNLQTQ